MALTPSTMLPLGTQAPEFALPDVSTGKTVRLSDFNDKKALLVMFICQHCPYVQHIKDELSRLGDSYKTKNSAIVGISANDAANYPDDSPAALKTFVKSARLSFPLLYDESQETAHAYTAACTPDFFLFDAARKLVYRGQLDDSRPGNGKPVTGRDLRAAMDAVLSDQPVPTDQKPSIGCNIKWKAGREPDYFRR
jgi:peroxiredoxin